MSVSADIPSEELAIHAARKMRDKGAEELTVLHLPEEQRSLYDFVVIGNGRSERQARTLAEEVYHFCKRHAIPHFPVEGEAGWYVIDCHDIVVHAFTPEARERYRPEELWSAATGIDLEAGLDRVTDLDQQVQD